MGGEMGRFFKDITSAPDRGKSFYQQERQRQHLASLVEAGRCAVTARQWSIDSDLLVAARHSTACRLLLFGPEPIWIARHL